MKWLILIGYGVLLWILSPWSRDREMFYEGRSETGSRAGFWLLTGSVFVSWIFAKSITNAANLGASYGLVGGLAYAAWFMSIPVAGILIYYIRQYHGVTSLPDFLRYKYGRWATLTFMIAIFIRLFNEIWSNIIVVGTYFGAKGTTPYYLACFVFVGMTLAYSLRGGLRSSLITDAAQVCLMVFFIMLVMGFIVPARGKKLVTAGTFSLSAGLDLLLVGLLQSLSYPFHDPVLTDRGFISDRDTMLKSFLVAGTSAILCIGVFSFVGVYAYLGGLSIQGDAPPRVAQSLGVSVLLMMNVIMLTSAGSTLDSTFASLAREIGVDVVDLTDWFAPGNLPVGRWVMVIMASVGIIPLFSGARILQATTLSGTMVMGLAPIFLLFWWDSPGSLAFHLSFWFGLTLGLWKITGTVPTWMAIGSGDYAKLLGVNFYGLLVCFVLFMAGGYFSSGSKTRTGTSQPSNQP